jgi:diguanylate cyclase (GGDEF)-like protein
MSGAPAKDAFMVAERLRAAIGSIPIAAEGADLRVTVSVGVAAAEAGATADGMIAAADAALYRAKKSGRDRVELASSTDWPQEPGGIGSAG